MDIPLEHLIATVSTQPVEPETFRLGDPISLAELERLHIEAVLRSEPSTTRAALVLGVAPSTLWRKQRRWAKQDRTRNPLLP